MNNNTGESMYEKAMREHRDKDRALPVPLKELDTIEKIINVLKIVPLTQKQRDIYEDKLKILLDEESILETARMKGIEQYARKALVLGYSEEKVSELSGLPLEEIKSLKIAIERLWEQDRKLHW